MNNCTEHRAEWHIRHLQLFNEIKRKLYNHIMLLTNCTKTAIYANRMERIILLYLTHICVNI